MTRRIINVSRLALLSAAFLVACFSVNAQFILDKGGMASHWKALSGDLENYRWLNNNEVLYALRAAKGYRFVKWDLSANKEQELARFSQLVRESIRAPYDPPLVFPSPNGQQVAWIVGGTTLWVASLDGAVIASHRGASGIAYPYWSEDSRCCYCFLEGYIPEQGPAYTAIGAIKMNMPFAVTHHLILDGSLMGETRFGPTHLFLSSVHFKQNGRISLVARNKPPKVEADATIIEEYTLTDSAKLVTMHDLATLPANSLVIKAVFSPTGDAIAWRFRNNDTAEIWMSDGDGNHMVRLGKLLQKEIHLPGDYDTSGLQWLPNGKGISFREAGELWVVYL